MRLPTELLEMVANYFSFYKAISVLGLQGHEKFKSCLKEDWGKIAVKMVYFETVKWMHRYDPNLLVNAIENASRAGNLVMVKWLLSTGYQCTTAAMNCAAQNGHLKVVKWLHENRTEGCTRKAMDRAAFGGHLEVVKWLHENRTEGCTRRAMDGAAFRGHLEVVKFLYENRTEGCISIAKVFAAKNGHLPLTMWLHEKRTDDCEIYDVDFNVKKLLNRNKPEVCMIELIDSILQGMSFG